MSKSKEQEQTRVVKGLRKVWHDLFKLLPAEMAKNVSYTKKPRYEFIQHQHFFHTVDSSGREQTKTHEVGGHYHDVKVIKQDDGKPPKLEISKPLRLVKINEDGEFRNVPQEIPNDNHTHDYIYVLSEEVEIRQINPEAIKLQSIVESKGRQSLEGVLSK